MVVIVAFKTCHTINFTIMMKKHYATPVTEIEVQAYTESSLLQGTVGPHADPISTGFREGIPTAGGSVSNPSFLKQSAETGTNMLWDDDDNGL